MGSRSTGRSGRFDPRHMALIGRIGAYAQQSRHDPRETTASARRVFHARFEREVDPDGMLPVEERQRRAEAARSAYFARLALASARARRSGKAARPPRPSECHDELRPSRGLDRPQSTPNVERGASDQVDENQGRQSAGHGDAARPSQQRQETESLVRDRSERRAS
jgi:hypothetical protein